MQLELTEKYSIQDFLGQLYLNVSVRSILINWQFLLLEVSCMILYFVPHNAAISLAQIINKTENRSSFFLEKLL